MALYPDDPRVPQAQKIIASLKGDQARGNFDIARFYEKRKKWEGARIYYNEVLLAGSQLAVCDRSAATHRPAQAAHAAGPPIDMSPGRWLLVGLVALGGSGCAGYKLGPVNGQVAARSSVQVNPFANQTLEPRLGDEVTGQLRQQLQRDGTFRLASHEDGDIVITGTVTQYHRQEVSLQPTDTLTVRDYRLELRAQVKAHDRSTGKLLLNQPVTGYTLIRVTSNLTSTERQAVPLLAADLAKNVTALLAEGSW